MWHQIRLFPPAFGGKEPSNKNYFEMTKMKLTKMEVICYSGFITARKNENQIRAQDLAFALTSCT